MPDIHCMLEIVGRGGIMAAGLYRLSCEIRGRGCPVPQILRRATSEGPVQPNIQPDSVTIEEPSLDLSSMSSFETVISFNAGIEKARVVVSPKTPTRAKPWPSNSVTQADSQKKSSNDFDAPRAVAGLKIRASV